MNLYYINVRQRYFMGCSSGPQEQGLIIQLKDAIELIYTQTPSGTPQIAAIPVIGFTKVISFQAATNMIIKIEDLENPDKERMENLYKDCVRMITTGIVTSNQQPPRSFNPLVQ